MSSRRWFRARASSPSSRWMRLPWAPSWTGALADKERGYGKRKIDLADDARQHLIAMSNGDARSLLNALELAVESTQPDEDGSGAY